MRRILLIDDDPVEAKLLAAFLRQRFDEAFDLVHVQKLGDAVIALRCIAFDAVLLDNRLPPYRDFRETLPVLRQAMRGDEPIIISSSLHDPCFSEADLLGEAPVVDKLHLNAKIGAGLLG